MSFDMATATVLPIDRSASRDAPRKLVGGKARELMRLANIGLRVPPGFVLGTDMCAAYLELGDDGVRGLQSLLASHLRQLGEATGRRFGDRRRPLLVSVRSGAPVSMPGMLDTILDVGLCDHTAPGLLRTTGNPRLVHDAYRRLIQGFAEVVFGCGPEPFDAVIEALVAAEGVDSPRELDSAGLKAAVRAYLAVFEQQLGRPFPQDPLDQLELAVKAVFESWNSRRATEFRRMKGLEGLPGTAATVQAMVFGNAGGASGSGVAFTRNPATGANELYVDFLINAQGDDVVSGRYETRGSTELEQLLPAVHEELLRVRERLELEYRDVQDFEFTVQEGELYLLQTRRAKRTAWAALRIAVDMVQEELIDVPTALARLEGYDVDSIRRVRLASSDQQPLARAISAGVGVAVGRIALQPESARDMAASGARVILVRDEISTSDVGAMALAEGVLTARGGRTSHAAVVARELDRVCLVGCNALRITADGKRCSIADRDFHEGDTLSLDGNAGLVYEGTLEVTTELPERELAVLRSWRTA